MEIIYARDFKKSVPGQGDQLEKIVRKLRKELAAGGMGIWETSLAKQSRKFHGGEKLFKFRVNDGDRIIFTYTDYMDLPPGAPRGMVLLEYVKHDEQERRARAFGRSGGLAAPAALGSAEAVERVRETWDPETVSFRDSLEPYATEEEYRRDYGTYGKYLDLKNTVAYVTKWDEEADRLLEDALLSEEQFSLVQETNSVLLLGGAGSGKTVICIHRLAALQELYPKTCYFTYSEKLCRDARRLLKAILPGETEKQRTGELCTTIEEYCCKLLGVTAEKLVNYSRFCRWLEGSLETGDRCTAATHGMDPYNIWAEIRGILKGYMGENWYRSKPFVFNRFPEAVNKRLEKEGLIQYRPESRTYRLRSKAVLLPAETLQRLQRHLVKDEVPPGEAQAVLKALAEVVQESRTLGLHRTERQKDLLSLEEYLALDEARSVFSPEERRTLHQIATAYQNWLQKNDLWDDNDLALAVMKLAETARAKGEPLFDALVVDEVQDLTEVQIRMLTLLVPSMEDIFFAGDANQIINPTYYSNERLAKLKYLQTGKADRFIRTLQKNYRSQAAIVELANRLSEIRRKCIAKEDEKSELLETAVTYGNLPFRLEGGRENLRQALEVLSETASAAILVAEEEDAELLRKRYPDLRLDNLYTVREAKGREFEYVFTWNITGRYKEAWQDILSLKARKNALYRYYFNLFYVSITRARRNLCVYEDRNVFEGYEDLYSYFSTMEGFDPESLGMTGREMSPAEWCREAKRLEEDGLYSRAALYYSHGGDERAAARCTASGRYEAGEFREGVEALLDLEEYDLAAAYAAKLAPQKFGDLQYITAVLTGKARPRLSGSDLLLRYLEHSTSAETAARADRFLAWALAAAAEHLEAAAAKANRLQAGTAQTEDKEETQR